MKPLWKVTCFEQHIYIYIYIYLYVYYLQHRTAQRMTARRRVIHSSSSLLSSLIPFNPLFHARKITIIISGEYCQEIIMVALQEFGSFARTGLCVAAILGENKKRRLVIILAPMVIWSQRKDVINKYIDRTAVCIYVLWDVCDNLVPLQLRSLVPSALRLRHQLFPTPRRMKLDWPVIKEDRYPMDSCSSSVSPSSDRSSVSVCPTSNFNTCWTASVVGSCRCFLFLH